MNLHLMYHANCSDGACAAAVVLYWAAQGKDEVTLHPVKYGEPVPEVPEDAEVWVLDHTLNGRESLLELRAKVQRLVVLDHHPAAGDLGLDFVLYEPEESGASLTWRYLFGGDPVPTWVQYVRDRDLWLNELPMTKLVAAFARLVGPDPWEHLALIREGDQVIDWAEQGRRFLAFQARQVQEELAKPEVLVVLSGKVVRVFWASPFLASDLGQAGLRDGVDACLILSGDKASFRSQDGVTARELAEVWGGGGHGNSAGAPVPFRFFNAEVVAQDGRRSLHWASFLESPNLLAERSGDLLNVRGQEVTVRTSGWGETVIHVRRRTDL